jgi:hypothetical protein
VEGNFWSSNRVIGINIVVMEKVEKVLIDGSETIEGHKFMAVLKVVDVLHNRPNVKSTSILEWHR